VLAELNLPRIDCVDRDVALRKVLLDERNLAEVLSSKIF